MAKQPRIEKLMAELEKVKQHRKELDDKARSLEEKIRECLTLGTPQEMCHAMEEAVLEKREPYQDNYTALVVRCGY